MASGACKLAIRLLYEAAVGKDKGYVSGVLTHSKLPSREKYEQAAYAYACIVYRAGNVNDDVEIPSAESAGAIEPLSSAQLKKHVMTPYFTNHCGRFLFALSRSRYASKRVEI